MTLQAQLRELVEDSKPEEEVRPQLGQEVLALLKYKLASALPQVMVSTVLAPLLLQTGTIAEALKQEAESP